MIKFIKGFEKKLKEVEDILGCELTLEKWFREVMLDFLGTIFLEYGMSKRGFVQTAVLKHFELIEDVNIDGYQM